MTLNETKTKIAEDPDFINLKRFDYSLAKLLERYPEGVPVRLIAGALLITEAEVEKLYQQVVVKLRNLMGVE